jgi:hypothetical protein
MAMISQKTPTTIMLIGINRLMKYPYDSNNLRTVGIAQRNGKSANLFIFWLMRNNEGNAAFARQMARSAHVGEVWGWCQPQVSRGKWSLEVLNCDVALECLTPWTLGSRQVYWDCNASSDHANV